VEIDQVWVRHIGQRAELALQAESIRDGHGVEQLEGYVETKFEIRRAIDLTHTPASQRLVQTEAWTEVG
jgi:hypothetical protein